MPSAPDDAETHFGSIDILNRDIRQFTANMLDPNVPYAKADLVASLIEEGDWTASLGQVLYQVARRVERQRFSEPGRKLVDETLEPCQPIGAAKPPSGPGWLHELKLDGFRISLSSSEARLRKRKTKIETTAERIVTMP